jgi:crotonobetainyl-CoA:carnitine CoA-transferase CaiB-like acyl-CoA transferase
MYGPEGPLAHLGGQDPLGQAAAGVEWDGGPVEAGNPPLWSRFGLGDTANALASVVGVMLALAHRDRTGEGQYVWSSILHSLAYYGADVHLTENGPVEGPTLDEQQTGLAATYRLYRTQGGWLQVAAVHDRQWVGLCTALGHPELTTDERFATPGGRARNRGQLEALLEPVFETQTALQWRRRLDEAGVPCEIPVETLDGESVLFDDEFLRLGLVAELEHPVYGRVRQVGNLMTFSATPGRVERPSPLVGQHTRELLGWLGHDTAAIDALVARGVIACADT